LAAFGRPDLFHSRFLRFECQVKKAGKTSWLRSFLLHK
jgi:hypothetical protein